MKIREKKAISLIVLVITILVLSILAATVIISLSNTNIIGETSKTVLKSDLAAMQDMATVYLADNYNSIDMEKEYLITEFGITDDEFKDYRDFTFVKAGKVYIKPNAPEDMQEVAKELNMLVNGVSSSTGDVTVEKTVKTLRIYGNTESTKSVGEKTKNLFEATSNTIVNPGVTYASNLVIEKSGFSAAIGSSTIDTSNVVSYKNGYVRIYVLAKEGTFTLSGKYDVLNQGEVTDLSNVSGDVNFYIGDTWTKRFVANWVNGNFTLTYTISDVDQDTTAYFEFPLCGNTVKYYDMQLEEGSTATEYEPYGYNVSVTTVGKNIFDYVNAKYNADTTLKDNGIYHEGSNNIRFSVYQDLQKYIGKTVTMSFDVTVSEDGKYGVFQYQDNGIGIKFNKVWEDLVANTPKRITVTGEVAELGNLEGYSQGDVIVYKEGYTGSYFVENIQIEEGTTATAYEAYTSKTYNMYLNEPLRKLGKSVDYLDCTTGEVVRYIGVKDTGELEALSTPTKENATVETIDFTNVKHVFVNSTVTPSNIEVKY